MTVSRIANLDLAHELGSVVNHHGQVPVGQMIESGDAHLFHLIACPLSSKQSLPGRLESQHRSRDDANQKDR